MTRAILISIAVIIDLTTAGCGIALDIMAKDKLNTLSVGMAKEEVSTAMRTEGVLSGRNPTRREIFRGSSGSIVEVWYYLTNVTGQGEKERLTPVIFENDKLVGIGWRMLEETSKFVGVPPGVSRQTTTSQGTAFAVRSDGIFLTAFHIVKDAKTITVTCAGEGAFPATVAGAARRTDLAILRAGRPTPHYLSLAGPKALRPGDHVFTVGFPATDLLGTEPKFTDGSVSALSGPGDEATLIQITVPVQPGNSGGPLLNDAGQVVGVVTSTAAVRAFLEGTGTLPQNVNWAVKSDYAFPLFEPPRGLAEPGSRTGAIDLATKATCIVEATR